VLFSESTSTLSTPARTKTIFTLPESMVYGRMKKKKKKRARTTYRGGR
jgi:hypothetical protein